MYLYYFLEKIPSDELIKELHALQFYYIKMKVLVISKVSGMCTVTTYMKKTSVPTCRLYIKLITYKLCCTKMPYKIWQHVWPLPPQHCGTIFLIVCKPFIMVLILELS